MKRSALCLAILCALSHPSAWAETKELWAYGVSKNGGWYDTTKVNPTGSVEDPKPDSQMCWAATAANMISWWQHWDENNSALAPQGALNIYDRIKADYGQNLADSGAVVGLEWWFNGGSDDLYDFVSAQSWHYGQTVFSDNTFKGFYPSLNWGWYDNVKSDTSSLSYSSVYSSLVSSFNSSQAVGLGIFPTNGLGHSITLWGIEYDSDTQTISKLYVTDSDDYGTGLFALDCSKGDDGLMYLSSDDHATYKTENYHVDNLVTLGLISTNDAASEDPLSGYNSNFYALEEGVITKVASESTPSVDDSGNVKFLGKTTLSQTSSAYELNLHAGSTASYKKINNVDFGSQTISLSKVRLEAHGEVTANCASLEVNNSTLIGQSISLSNSTEVEMTNAWIETTGTKKGESTNTTFKGTGTIKNMRIDGGKLISGNSPGLLTLENTELVSTTLSFYLGAGNQLSTLSDGHISIKLDTTLRSGVVVGDESEAVSSGFLLTSAVTLSSSITLDVWNIEKTTGDRYFLCDGYSSGGYFSEGDYIQVIAFGEGVTYHDVLRTTFDLSSNIKDGLLALKDPNLTNASWRKQVRTDGVYLVLSALPVYDVPEPAAGGLVLTGLGLLLRRRRRS